MLSGVPKISAQKYSELCDFAIESGSNLIALALAGTGKSEIAMAACDKAKIKYIYLNMSVMESPELVGLPEKDREKNVVRYIPPEFMPQTRNTAEPVVLIVDEVDKLKSELQGPLLEIFQFRTINGTPLNIKAIIATGNLPDEGAFSLPISHALTNRCMTVVVEPDYIFWQNWAVSKKVNPLVIGFLSRNQGYFAPPVDKTDPTAYCRPSPRAWTLAARKLDDLDKSIIRKDMKDEELVDMQSRIVAGYVGLEPANKFKVWLTHYRFIVDSVDALVDKGITPKEMEIDRKMVFAIAACSTLASKQVTKQIMRAQATNVFNFIKTLNSDLQLAAVKSSLTTAWAVKNELFAIDSVKTVFAAINKILDGNNEDAEDEAA